ncbi:alpha-L-fucosidase [Dermatobacter hominis]|uniref:alpha-L-fucosidase n=1 Tax=Dermatobacter hominis TaxID=2884263 RepID=UPI001D111834|nr:alpha-L-fucosidase [Dermatobacter hominis]UDY34682.1 alpha-L-fucosidase [Dermatobacter hominis]
MPRRKRPSARAELKALRRHRVPAWWSDAKLGIFVHWTPASVAGFAPVDSEIGELLAAADPDALAENPYTEWYENSLRFPGSSASRFHRETFGLMPYAELADRYRDGLATWDPDDWARRFAATGARYVVLVTKHHDGFCLWPSDVQNPHRAGWHTGRDVVGELREAVLAAGMRFGVYYSGGLDWTFDDRPIGNLGAMLAAVPRGDYPAYAAAQVRELIGRYRPSVLWNDIAWPAPGPELWPLFADYYRAVPDGVVNDRWMPWSPVMAAARNELVRRAADSLNARATRSAGGIVPPKPPFFDVQTPEYVVFDEVRALPWECVRGMDQSFGYNRASRSEHFLSDDELLDMAADITAKGGNLLLNVGPRGEDAQIPAQQLALLDTLAAWAGVGDGGPGPGAAMFGSRPWVRPTGEGSTRGPGGSDGAVPLRFWARDRSVDVAVLGRVEASLLVPGLGARPTTAACVAEGAHDGEPLRWSGEGTGIRVELPASTDRPVLRLRDVDAVPVG